MIDSRIDRILSLVAAAQTISDSHSPLGKRARVELQRETGLSHAGVDYALAHCLEHHVSRGTLTGLVKTQKRLPRSHVLLSANVFTAAFRAIVLGLCQSENVQVRASRRAETFPRLLHEASEGAFDLVAELHPEPGESFWVYGSTDTIKTLRQTLPSGVKFHAHGPGMGAAVFKEHLHYQSPDLPPAVAALARDIIPFDQRGCLSPRVVIIEGSRTFAELVCNLLVQELTRLEQEIPRGELSPAEAADALRYEASVTFVGSSVPAGMGMVFLDPVDGRVLVPPVGRYVHVSVTDDSFPLLKGLGPQLTGVAFYNSSDLQGRLREAIGDRRYVDMGQMQHPAFDGPVDLRHGFTAELL